MILCAVAVARQLEFKKCKEREISSHRFHLISPALRLLEREIS